MIKGISRKYAAVLLILCSAIGRAQEYQWKAALDTVKEEGFYKIVLTPELSGKTQKGDLSDIRIYNSRNEEVPYLLRQEPAYTSQEWFKEYTILSKDILPGKNTSIIIHNPGKNNIDNFSLVVKNNNASKFAKLSGSDDNANWYFITSDYPLNQMYDANGLTSEKNITFPLSNYEYYKLEINDSIDGPLNIMKIGNHDHSSQEGTFLTLTPEEFQQTEQPRWKTTELAVSFSSNYHINGLAFRLEGPKYYRREAVLYRIDTTAKGEPYRTHWSTFYLSSNADNRISIPELYGKELLVAIRNGDNAPLKIQSVEGFQVKRYLVTQLEDNESYTLVLGNKSAHLPHYDLEYFSSDIPHEASELQVLTLESMGTATPPSDTGVAWFKSKWWIWGAIALIMALLVFVSVRMLREMENQS